MSKQTQQFFEQIKSGGQPTLIEGIREASFSMKEIGGQIWDGLKPMFDHGRTEAAAALFSGQGHVMYMRRPGRHRAGTGSGTRQRNARRST